MVCQDFSINILPYSWLCLILVYGGDYMDVGTRIKELRKERGLTQIEVAQKAGIAVNSLRLYEANKRQPRLKQLQSIAAALDVSIARLIGSMDERGTIDIGLTAIALSEMMGIDRMSVLKALESDFPENPFNEQSYKEVREKAKKIQFSETVRRNFELSQSHSSSQSFNIGEIIAKALADEKDGTPDRRRRLLSIFDNLNPDGQEVAISRISELAEIPRYHRLDTTQPEK